MSTLSTPPVRLIGCDVGKASIVVFDSASGSCRSVPNRKPDLLRLARTLAPDCLVVCEATGGYEAKLLAAMLVSGIPAHRADARKVKAFIRSFGTLGKSDAIDAQALARYGAERWAALALWQQPDPVREEVQALVLTRIALVKLQQAQKNRLAAPQATFIAATVRALLREIQKQIRALEARIRALVQSHPVLARDMAIMRANRGIGDVTAAGLLGLMPELGHLTGAQAAALAGVAPHPHESGKRIGYRRTRGGRPDVKRLLFMAALTASRAKGKLNAFYEKMIARGKKPIVAVTAVMRKLIVIINAQLRDARRNNLNQATAQLS